jgi:hypothetical protein
MKRIFKHWGLYVVVLCLFGADISCYFIEPDWIGRIVGRSFFYFLPLPVAIWALFQKENFLLGKGNWFEDYFEKSKVDFWTKILIFCLGIGWSLTAGVSYIKDLQSIITNKTPSEIVVTIIDVSSGKGALSVHLTTDGNPRYYSAYNFPRNTFEEGYTYKLWYLPNTHEVVDAELISSNDN